MGNTTPHDQYNERQEEAVSVKVTIEHDEGAFRRTLEIKRTSSVTVNEEGFRALDEVGTYDVTLSNGSRTVLVASFGHRYGDDLLTLFDEAVKALGGLGGPSTTGLKR